MIIIMVSVGVNILRHCPIGQSTGMPFVFTMQRSLPGYCFVCSCLSVIVWILDVCLLHLLHYQLVLLSPSSEFQLLCPGCQTCKHTPRTGQGRYALLQLCKVSHYVSTWDTCFLVPLLIVHTYKDDSC